jgi:hypothetical protein
MDIQGMDDAFERVAKKQKTTYTKTNEVIDKLLENIKQAQELVISNPATRDILGGLQAKVNELGPQGQIAGAHVKFNCSIPLCPLLTSLSLSA